MVSELLMAEKQEYWHGYPISSDTARLNGIGTAAFVDVDTANLARVGRTQEKAIMMTPFGKERPRRGKNGRMFMRAEYKQRKKQLHQAFGPVEVRGLIRMEVTAVRPLPKSWSKKKKDDHRGQYASPTPDTDNIIGAVMDALFPDNDNMVVEITARKIWGDLPKIIIKLQEVASNE